MDWNYWINWVYYVSLLVLLFTGLFVNILGLPGLWLMVAAHAAFGWLTGWDAYVGWPSVVTVVVLAAIAEVVEFVAGAAGSKSAGGSKRGMAGAIVGGLLGGFFLTFLVPIPILGTIVGVCAGTFLGALGVELMVGKEMGESTQIGIGAAKGRLLGIIGKSAFGCAILLVSAITALPIGGATPTVAPPFTPSATTPAPVPATAPATTAPTAVPASPTAEPMPAVER